MLSPIVRNATGYRPRGQGTLQSWEYRRFLALIAGVGCLLLVSMCVMPSDIHTGYLRDGLVVAEQEVKMRRQPILRGLAATAEVSRNEKALDVTVVSDGKETKIGVGQAVIKISQADHTEAGSGVAMQEEDGKPSKHLEPPKSKDDSVNVSDGQRKSASIVVGKTKITISGGDLDVEQNPDSTLSDHKGVLAVAKGPLNDDDETADKKSAKTFNQTFSTNNPPPKPTERDHQLVININVQDQQPWRNSDNEGKSEM